MKKRKLKKSVIVFLIFFIILIFGLIIFLKNTNKQEQKEKVIDKPAEKVIKSEDKKKSMSLIAVGDVLIHDSVYKDAEKKDGTYDFSKMFTSITPIIQKYDLRFCNQESTIGGKVLGISGYPNFNSPDEIGDQVVNMGFNLISLANNHVFDRGESAVDYSVAYWNSKDVITAGSYSSDEERNKVRIYEKNGIKYAFLAYTTLSNGNVTKSHLLNMYSDEIAKKDIESVKDQVDVIIVSMHWGEEYTNIPTNSQKRIAQYLSGLGVNLIIGHHSHVVQPVEYINDTLVIYSLGNFISNQLSIADLSDPNQGIGLMYGIDIVLNDDKSVTFENEYKELILAYAQNSTNFKVIPFSELNDDLLPNYQKIGEKYMKIVNGE